MSAVAGGASYGVSVEVAALRGHSRNVAALGAEVARARTAAAQVDLGPDTFGSVGALLVGPALGPLQAVGVTVLDLVGGALGSSASGVADVAAGFERADRGVRAHFDGVASAVVRLVTDVSADTATLRDRLGSGVRPLVVADAPPVRALADRLAS